MPLNSEIASMINDAFISYSRKDKEFASRIEKALEDYKPPKELNLPQRNLVVFRDEADMTGAEYIESIERHLRNSAKMIVICSTNSRNSNYVNDEIRIFVKAHGSNNIFPILLAGLPNNEAGDEQQSQIAFPDALCEVQKIPLATDYRGFDSKKDKVNRGRFESQWFTVLSNLYDCSRNEIEQRDKKRQLRRRNIAISISGGVIMILIIFLVYALISRQEAIQQRKLADERRRIGLSRQLAAQSQNLLDKKYDLSLLLAVESLHVADTSEAHTSLFNAVSNKQYFLKFLNGHQKAVRSVDFSKDGKIIASGSEDKSVILWDGITGQAINSPLTGHSGKILAVAFSPDGKTLASASEDKTIILWDVPTGKALYPALTGHSNKITAIAFNHDGNFLASLGPEIIIWDIAERTPVIKISGGDSGYAGSISFSPNDEIFAHSHGKTIIIREVRAGNVATASLEGHNGPVSSVAFSPNGDLLASASYDGKIIIWDVFSRKQIGEPLIGHLGKRISTVSFSPNGELLVSAGEDRTIILWDVSRQKAIGSPLTGHSQWIHKVVFSPDGKKLSSASDDNKVILWDIFDKKPIRSILKGHNKPVKDIFFSIDNKTMLSRDSGNTLVLWRINSQEPTKFSQITHVESVTAAAIGPDNKILAIGSSDNAIIFFDLADMKPLGTTLIGHKAPLNHLVFSSDGNTLISADRNNNVYLWDVANKKLVNSGHFSFLQGVAFNANSKMFASIYGSTEISFWDIISKERRGLPLKGHADVINTLIFRHDGELLASAGNDTTIMLWDATSQRPVGEPLLGHSEFVTTLAFNIDGKILASGSQDKSVILWDLNTRAPFCKPLVGYDQSLTSIAFSHNDKILATASADGLIIIWDLDLEVLEEEACSMANHNLSHKEWGQYLGDEDYRKTCPNLP